MVVGHAAEDQNKSESPAGEKNHRGPVHMKCVKFIHLTFERSSLSLQIFLE